MAELNFAIERVSLSYWNTAKRGTISFFAGSRSELAQHDPERVAAQFAQRSLGKTKKRSGQPVHENRHVGIGGRGFFGPS
jgi:hypothetical protein